MPKKKSKPKSKTKRQRKPPANRKPKSKKKAAKTYARCPDCSRWLDYAGAPHICRPFREEDVVENLTDDLRDAWLKLRDFAANLGEQRIYASEKAIMFSRKVCYLFMRPKKSYLEVVFFLPREVASADLKIEERTSRTKYAHSYRLRHPDQVEEPLTDWIWEAYKECRTV